MPSRPNGGRIEGTWRVLLHQVVGAETTGRGGRDGRVVGVETVGWWGVETVGWWDRRGVAGAERSGAPEGRSRGHPLPGHRCALPRPPEVCFLRLKVRCLPKLETARAGRPSPRARPGRRLGRDDRAGPSPSTPTSGPDDDARADRSRPVRAAALFARPLRRGGGLVAHGATVPRLSVAGDQVPGPVREPGALRPADGELQLQRLVRPSRPGAAGAGAAVAAEDAGGRPLRPGPAVPHGARPGRAPRRPSRRGGRGRSARRTPNSTGHSSSRRTTPTWPATSFGARSARPSA